MNPEWIRPIITSLILLVALATFGYTAYNRISLMFRGRKKLNRLDNIPQRILGVLQYAIAQQRMRETLGVDIAGGDVIVIGDSFRRDCDVFAAIAIAAAPAHASRRARLAGRPPPRP